MSSSHGDNRASTPPPLSATCSGTTVPTVNVGAAAATAAAPQRPRGPHLQQQHVDLARLLTYPSSSSCLAHDYSKPGVTCRGGLAFTDTGSDRREAAYWGSRPAHLSVSPPVMQLSEKSMAAVAAKAGRDGATYNGAMSGGSGVNPPEGTSSPAPELQTAAAAGPAAAATITPNNYYYGEAGSNDNKGGFKLQGSRSVSSEAAAGSGLAADAVTHRMLHPQSPAPRTAAPQQANAHSSHSNDAPKKSASNYSGPSPSSSQTRTPSSVAAAASTSTLSRKSRDSTPASGDATTPVMGSWVHTPLHTEFDTQQLREGLDAAAASATSAHMLCAALSSASDASPSPPYTGTRARNASAPSIASPVKMPAPAAAGKVVVPLRCTPPALVFTPSEAAAGKEAVKEHAGDASAAANPATTTAVGGTGVTATTAAAIATAAAAGPARRVKRRPPSLFTLSPMNPPVAPMVTTSANSAAPGPPSGRPPALGPSSRAHQEVDAAAEPRSTGGGLPFTDGAHDGGNVLSHSSSLTLASLAESSKLLLPRQTITATTTSGFSGNSLGITTTPTSAAGYPEDRQRFRRTLSVPYATDLPSASANATHPVLFTLISATNDEVGDDDSSIGRGRDSETGYAARHPPRHFSQASLQPRPQQAPQVHGLQGASMLAFSPPRLTCVAPLMTPLNTASNRKEHGSTSTASSQSSSLTNNSSILGTAPNLASRPAVTFSETRVASLPLTSLCYGSSRAGSMATARRCHSATSMTAISPSGGSFGAAASHCAAGSSTGEPDRRAGSGDAFQLSYFASPTLSGGNARGTRPLPLALTPVPTTNTTTASASTTANAAASTTITLPQRGVTTTISTATASSVPSPGVNSVAAITSSASAAASPAVLPTPMRTAAARRRAAPPSLFKARSPVSENSGAGGSETMTSPKSADPGFVLHRTSVTSSSALFSPPLNVRLPGSIIGGSRAASETGGGAVFDGIRTVGNSATTTPNVNTNACNHIGSVSMYRSASNRPQSGAGSGGNALVRLSHDRRTLIAGIFRVSRDGCLTVRNMLLLNPTRIDAATVNPVGAGSHDSPLGADKRRPVQLLHPQRTGAINYSPVSSNSGATGRMLMPQVGHVPGSPNVAGSDWCSPQGDGPAVVLGSAGFHRAGTGSGPRGMHTGYDVGASNPNASFTLFSTSMDTPFSPITYSLDSQRMTFPNSSGYNHERSSGLMPPPSGPQLLRAVRDEAANGANNLGNSTLSNTNTSEATPTTTAGNYVGAGNAGGGGSGTQAITPGSTLHNRAGGGAGNTFYRAQLRRQTSVMQNIVNAVSPTALQTVGSVGSMLSSCALNAPDAASSLLIPYVDIPIWKNGVIGVGPQHSSNFVGSPATHTNPNLHSSGFTTTSTAGMNTAGTANPQLTSATSLLPPNVVRLRDLEVLLTSVGEGASATVFVAIHKPTGRRLAVKRVDLSPLCLGYTSTYLRSGRIRQLQHIVIRELQVLHLTYRSPFMVKVYNAFFLPECAALDIVMEFMHYGSLDHLASALQKHARLLRESQQQRNRLLLGEDDAGGLGSPPSSGSDGVLTSPYRNLECGAPQALSAVENAQEVEASVGGPSSGIGGGEGGPHTGDGNGHGGAAHVSYLSPKMLNFGGRVDEPPVQLQRRRLGLGVTHDLSTAAPPGVAAAAGGSSNANANTTNANDGESNSLQIDTFSVRSNCGTDDTELDDGSGHMEEPFGVAERLVAVVGEQLLRGVRDMHSRGYIHRDIKPGNVLVNEHGVVKLSDFGLSQRCDDSGTGIKNTVMTCIAPPSIMPTRASTPICSPSMAVLQLGGSNGGGAGWASRRSNTFSPHAPHPLGLNENSPHQQLRIGLTSLELGSSSDRLMLPSSTMNSVAAQRDGMDVLDAESTSSSSTSDHNGGGDLRTGMLSSSSSSDSGGNCSGTDKYMSPERQRGEPHGKPADIWAVGVSLAEFAVGEYPYCVEDVIDEFDRVSRLEKPVDVLQFNAHRAAPLSTVFADFIRLATLPIASQRPTAQELLEHPFFKQWHRPFNLKDYLAARVPVPSNELKSNYLARHLHDGAP